MNLSSATPPRGYRKSGIAIGDSNCGPTPPSGSSRFAAATERLRRFDAGRGECQDRSLDRLQDPDHVALRVLEPRRLEITGVEDTVDRLHRGEVVLLEHDSFRPELTQGAGDVIHRKDHLGVAAGF